MGSWCPNAGHFEGVSSPGGAVTRRSRVLRGEPEQCPGAQIALKGGGET
jgi:hypothetical protein